MSTPTCRPTYSDRFTLRMKNTPHVPTCRAAALTLFAAMTALTQASAQTWTGNVASSANLTVNWNDPANWTPATVPNAAGATVTFSRDFLSAFATNVDLGGGTFTIGTLNMTDTATGTAGKLNFQTGTLLLDTGSAAKPVINYTTGGQFDNFMNVTLAGSNGFEKTGGGTVQVSGRNHSYTGVTKITGGGLRIDRNGSLGDGATGSGVELAGGTLYVRTNNNVALDNRAAFADPAGAAKRNISVTGGSAASPTQIQVEVNSTLVVSGNLTSNAGTTFRKTDVGTLTLSGSANSMAGVTEFEQGVVNVSGTFDTTGNLIVAKTNPGTAGRTSTLNWSGTGTVAQGATSFIVNDGGLNTSGTVNVTDGSLTVGGTGGRFVIGGKGAGTVNVSGGTLTVAAAKELSIGSFLQFGGANGNGTLTVGGGNVEVQGASSAFFVGYGQTAATSGGAFAGTGVVNLNGGTLTTARSITSGPGANGTFNFNGGTLKAGGNNATWMQGLSAARVGNGGAIIDTNGYDVTIGQALVANGTGGLTKNGLGTLILSGASDYAGATIVNQGVLLANGSLVSAVTVDGGTLGGSGSVGAITLNSGTLAPGGGLDNSLSSSGLTWNADATIRIDLSGASSSDLFSLTGAFTKGTGSGFAFDFGGGGEAGGSYGLGVFSSTNFVSGDFVANNLGAGLVGQFLIDGDSLTLNVSAIPEPSAFAVVAGLGAIGAAGLRRRRRAA